MPPTDHKFKSSAFESIHEAATALLRVGAIDEAKMREFDRDCLQPEPAVTLSIDVPGEFLKRIEQGALICGLQPTEFLLAAALAASDTLELEKGSDRERSRGALFKKFLEFRNSLPLTADEESALSRVPTDASRQKGC